MTDYGTLGLNENLRPASSPAVTNNEDRTTGYEFNSQNERDAITATNIQNFSFSTGRGGTLTLGGTANGNGYLSIKNDAGSVIVEANNTGLTINNGSIVINNSTGTTIVDATGLNSVNNFDSDNATNNSLQTTTSSSFVPATGGTLSSFVITRNTKIFLYSDVYAYNNSYDVSGNSCEFAVFAGTTELYNFFVTGVESVDWDTGTGQVLSSIISGQQATSMKIVNFPAGTHTLVLNYKQNGGGTAKLLGFNMGYIQLGQ